MGAHFDFTEFGDIGHRITSLMYSYIVGRGQDAGRQLSSCRTVSLPCDGAPERKAFNFLSGNGLPLLDIVARLL